MKSPIAVALALGAASVVALALSPQTAPAFGVAQGHTVMHLNCPPGSHGKPRFDGVGARLEAARALKDRAITAR